MTRPNVLWLSTHDINPHLGCYKGVWPGAQDAYTPRLDEMAREGVRYDNAYSVAPVCAPSRAAIYTGCYPTAMGAMHMRTRAVPPPEVRLFTEYFRAAGYWTTNNWFTDFQMQTPPTAFDDCSPTAHWRGRANADTPFFASFHGMVTHESQIYLDDEAFTERTGNVPPEQRHRPDRVQLPPYHPTTSAFQQAWARYHDLITELDHWVGTILDELDEDGLRDNTIVVFWSEHGLGMPRHKRWANEAGLREPLIVRWPRVLPQGTARTEIIQLLDLAPTMLKVCGLEVPPHMHGKPFLSATGECLDPNSYAFGARDRMDEQRDTTRTVRGGRMRYIRHLHPDRSPLQYCHYADTTTSTWADLRRLHSIEAGMLARGETPDRLDELQRSVVAAAKPAEELYDIESDPFETTNLIDAPPYADVAEELRGALNGWTEEYGDLGLQVESSLIEHWRPNGEPRKTATPECTLYDTELRASCKTPGASLGWTVWSPAYAEGVTDPLMANTGSPTQNSRQWQLYTGPVDLGRLSSGTHIWVGAWRLGFEQSDEVEIVIGD